MKKPKALVVVRDQEEWKAIALPDERNPYLVYIGGLDQASQPTMKSTARLVVTTLSGGRVIEPAHFPWHRLNYGIVKRLRSVLREKGFAPRSVNKALTFIRSTAKEAWLFKLISHEEYQSICEVENLDSKRLPAGRVVERDEIACLLMACHGVGLAERVLEDLNGLRDGSIISLLAGAGLRENEAVCLLRNDYDAEKGVIRVRFGKGHKQREAYMELGYEAPLRRFLAAVQGGANDPLLPRLSPSGAVIRPMKKISTQTVHKALARRGIQAGIINVTTDGKKEASFTPHDLRRSFITHQLEIGTDPLRIARAVGHSSPKTTMIYDRRTAESDRQAIRGDKNGDDKFGMERLHQESRFLMAIGGGDFRHMSGDQGMVELPMTQLTDPAWRAPLRDLRKCKEGNVYSIRLGNQALYTGKTTDLNARMVEHATIDCERGNQYLHQCLETYPNEYEQWTVRVWADVALGVSLDAAEFAGIASERPCFNSQAIRARGPVPERYRGIFEKTATTIFDETQVAEAFAPRGQQLDAERSGVDVRGDEASAPPEVATHQSLSVALHDFTLPAPTASEFLCRPTE